ncbi:HAD domain-containing protein [Paraburkholderia sp.]|uniref:HAD domain-containing protein n=1 Tax=Paraburkholderia sp. TaxID=1926495 RepID=UPI0025D18332|nr:HAD domain-containing protein [Paraburkholderia sp.]
MFLDYDNVLHRGDAYRTPNGIVSAPGVELFEFAAVLEQLLQPFNADIVLSTDWVSVVGFEAARDALPSSRLRERVVDATQPSDADSVAFRALPRGVQVQRYVRAHNVQRWLAVDDRGDGFENCRERLVRCQPSVGLGDNLVQQLLITRLGQLCQ